MGYKYSWIVSDDGDVKLSTFDVEDLILLGMTAAEIEAYKDWQVGDKVTNGINDWEVIFRSGKLVVCEKGDGCASTNHTCDELYDDGFRLVADPEPEDEMVELTLDEIAEKFGIKPENLRIKKEE